MALAMLDAHSGGGEQDRQSLDELADVVDPGSADAQLARIATYGNEANALFEKKARRTTVKLFDIGGPAIAQIAASNKDPKTLEIAWFTPWYDAHALMIAGQPDRALAMMTTGQAHLDPGRGQAAALRCNFFGLLVCRLSELINQHNNTTTTQKNTKHR